MPANFNFTSDEALRNDFVSAPDHKDVQPRAQEEALLTQMAPLVYDFDLVDEVVKWRDPRTAAAMKHATSPVQRIFQAAGFAFGTSGSDLAPGSYDLFDEQDRHDVIMRLTNAISEAGAEGLDWGQFDISAFFAAHSRAEGVHPGLPAGTALPQTSNNKRTFAFVVFAGGVILLGLAAAMML